MWKRCRYHATLAACLRNICRHNIPLWKLTKLFRTATSLCPLLLQMSNYMLLFILLKMHYSSAVFFPSFGSICRIWHLLTTFKIYIYKYRSICKVNLNSARYYRIQKQEDGSDPYNTGVASQIERWTELGGGVFEVGESEKGVAHFSVSVCWWWTKNDDTDFCELLGELWINYGVSEWASTVLLACRAEALQSSRRLNRFPSGNGSKVNSHSCLPLCTFARKDM